MWDFVKNAIVDDVAVVPEQFRGLYVKDDATGKFKIGDVAKPLVDMYVGVNTSYEKAKKDLATSNNESAARRVAVTGVVELAKKLGIEGVDETNPATALDTFTTELISKVKGGKDLTVNLENIKKEYEGKNKAITDAASTAQTKMLGSLQKHMIGSAVNAAMAKHQGNPALLTDMITGRAKVVQDGEEYVVRIMDESGSPRSNGAGGWLDIDGFVGELKGNTAYAGAFASEQKGGNGTKPGASNQKTQTNNTTEKTAVEKINAGLTKRMRAA